jgi:tRNA dimethylallyltransferase
MFAEGLVEEVQGLRALPRALSREATQALGYKEVLAFLDGRMTLEQCMAAVQTRSRNFAKRQITWFRHLPGCHPASWELTRALWKPTI